MMGPDGTEIAWPTKPQDKKSRTHNHHISLRERLKEHQNRTQEKHPKSEGGVHVTTKAAAWAVFQHHGGGRVALSQTHGSAVRCTTHFKIEAQMKHEVACPSVFETVAPCWDAGSTLFDSFELDSLLKKLDEAANSAGAAAQKEEEAGAIVVYSQKHWVARPNHNPPPQRSKFQHQRSFPSRGAVDDGRLDIVDETRPLNTAPVTYKLAGNLTLDDLYNRGKEDADSDPFANFGHTPSPFNVRRHARRSFDSSLQEKSGKGGSRDLNSRSRWKGLLHTLHLDSTSGLFNRFQGFHSQVAPHDSQRKLESKASRGRAKAEAAKPEQTDHGGGDYSPKRSIVSTSSVVDPRFDPKNLHISHPPAVNDELQQQQQRSSPTQSWKLGLKAMFSRPFSRQGSSLSEKSVSPVNAPRKSSSLRGQKADLQSAWSSLKSRHQKDDQDQKTPTAPQRRGARSVMETVSLSHHGHHQQHYYHHAPPPDPAANLELTFQAISWRVSRSSFEEKARKFSVKEGGTKAPRNSLATPRSSGDSAHDRNRRLTPWEAESSLVKGLAYVH